MSLKIYIIDLDYQLEENEPGENEFLDKFSEPKIEPNKGDLIALRPKNVDDSVPPKRNYRVVEKNYGIEHGGNEFSEATIALELYVREDKGAYEDL